MPSSGQIAILSCPQGVCSSIAKAVDGNVTPPKSLCCLGAESGFSVPFQMSDWYGFGGVSGKCISLCCISSVGCGSLEVACMYAGICYSIPMAASECYMALFNWCLCKPITTGAQCSWVELLCNGTPICSCSINSSLALNCSGSWSTPNYIKQNDTLQSAMCSRINAGNVLDAFSCLTLYGTTNCCGCFTAVAPLSQWVYTCGTIN